MKGDGPMTTVKSANSYLLKTEGLTKVFGSLVASDRIDLEVKPGSIHAILGENGAGKSTLMKMLYGVYEPDGGAIWMDGKVVELHPPTKARAKGIGMVFQDFRVVPALTILDNIALSVETGIMFNRKKLKKRIVEVSTKYGLAVDPDAYVWQLDLGQRQRLEIVKVLLAEGTRLIIFDEPTSVLVPQEVESFLQMLKLLRQDGYGILLITHKINEVLAVADQVSVLRSGVLTYSAAKEDGLTADELIAAMMGNKELKTVVKENHESLSDTALQIKAGTIKGDYGEVAIQDVNLTVKKGQIVGVAGISGSGQRELAEVLFGLRKLVKGTIEVKGEPLKADVKAFLEAGVSFVSEDPIKESVIPGFSILEHMVLDGMTVKKKGAGIDWRTLASELKESKEANSLALADGQRHADTLSGGNVQRMVLTRALIRMPELLIISYPSRGLDIGTTRTIQQHLVELTKQGTSIVLFSEDLDELFKLSDELVVLAGKRLTRPYQTATTDANQIGQLMLKGESA